MASLFIVALLAALSCAEPFNTFDGVGFPACNDVAKVYDPDTIDDMVNIIKEAASTGTPVRASGKAHMWYDTMCSDNSSTIIIRTEGVSQISDFSLKPNASDGTVMIEAGVTYFQLADYLHERNASVGFALVNWNITLAGGVAMGAHRSSLREDSMVAAGALEIHIIDGSGNIRIIKRDEKNEEWLAASTSLGLLGVIARMKFKIYPDTKVYADQKILAEDDVLNGDIYGMISPYATANFWWWPYVRKFHHRYYDVVPTSKSPQQGFQSTFSVTEAEANTSMTLLNAGANSSYYNELAETTFFSLWSSPNFREKTDNVAITTWPVYGWNYDVLIGGLYPGYGTPWEYGLHGYALELAFPITQANTVLKRIRKAFDDELLNGKQMTATYRSGINIKFGKPYYDLLGQVTYNTSDGADWSKGAIMFDFNSFKPTIGERYNEPFYSKLATMLVTEFPSRPHWTKNTRSVFEQAKKNIDPDHLSRFKAVREDFDPQGIFKSILGEIMELY